LKAALLFDQPVFAGLFDDAASAMKAALSGGTVAGEAFQFFVVFFGPLQRVLREFLFGLVVAEGVAAQIPFAFGGIDDEAEEIVVFGLVLVAPALEQAFEIFLAL